MSREDDRKAAHEATDAIVREATGNAQAPVPAPPVVDAPDDGDVDSED